MLRCVGLDVSSYYNFARLLNTISFPLLTHPSPRTATNIDTRPPQARTPFAHTRPHLVHTHTTHSSAHTYHIIHPPLSKVITCQQTPTAHTVPHTRTHHPNSSTHTHTTHPSAHRHDLLSTPAQTHFMCTNTCRSHCSAHPQHTYTPSQLAGTRFFS